jgi:tetratricopeptide (TPR) repeat protein
VNRWSNRFISLAALLLAACASTPRHATTEHKPDTAAAVPAANAAAANTANAAPVPAQAAQQYGEALTLMKAGRGADAELLLKRLAAAYPQFAGPQVNLGILYLQGSHLPEAEAAFKDALERNPGSAVAGNELGIVERRLGKFAEAEKTYQRTMTVEPDYAPTYLNLGVLYDLYLGQPQKALEQFEHYVQLAGENKQVAGWMAELRKRVGAPAQAAKKEPA